MLKCVDEIQRANISNPAYPCRVQVSSPESGPFPTSTPLWLIFLFYLVAASRLLRSIPSDQLPQTKAKQ